MRVFKTKPFARFANREGIAEKELCEAVRRAERGVIDADLGGGVLSSAWRGKVRASRVDFGASSFFVGA